MSAAETPVRRIRPRSRSVATLRIALPAVAAAVLLAVIGFAILGAVQAAHHEAASRAPVELVAPRLSGVDDQHRPFVITAKRAMRDGADLQRIRLEAPHLDRGGDQPMQATAVSGVYDQAAGRLELAGGVQLSGAQGAFTTPTAVYDTKAGELVGTGGVRASGSVGQLSAGSFTATDKGKSVIYKGGVHTRLNPKSH
jgi:lipopolysaccharide export system protein LptC